MALKTLFNLCNEPETLLDYQTLASDLMGNVMSTVQYDFEFGTNNIPFMCEMIGNGTTPLAGFASFYVNSSVGCTDALYTDMISQLQNITYDPAQNMRQWTWQTCTEFGYFQTTTSPNQPFAEGNLVPLSFYEQMCNDAFKTRFSIDSNILDTNTKFGGNNLPTYWTRNVAFDNSVVDPWHTLSVQSDVNEASPLYLFNDKGHCAAVSVPKDDDPDSIKRVRIEISYQINEWLSE